MTTPLTMQSGDTTPTLLAVRSDTDRYVAMLPWFEQWQVSCGPGVILDAVLEAGLRFTLNEHQPPARVEYEPYLREIHANNRRGFAERGFHVSDAVLTQEGDNVVLEYLLEGTMPTGQTVSQMNFWTTRRRADGSHLDAHLSYTKSDGAYDDTVVSTFRRLLGMFQAQ